MEVDIGSPWFWLGVVIGATAGNIVARLTLAGISRLVKRFKRGKEDLIIRCPKCGSTNVHPSDFPYNPFVYCRDCKESYDYRSGRKL